MSLWLPKFLQDSLISPPALWGKLPSRGDFIRHNIKHNQGEALQAWIAEQLLPSTVPAASSEPSKLPKAAVSRRLKADASLWHDLNQPASFSEEIVQPTVGHAGLPWCFVLPPGSLLFAAKEHVIGVWMASSDKVGRQYPLLMIQTAAPRWIRQHFASHTQQPCDWLFAVARAMARTVYADETQVDKPTGGAQAPDHLTALTTQLDALWQTMRPGWRQMLGGSAAAFDLAGAQALIGAPHPEDPVRHLDGVRYLPWANWPQQLTSSGAAPSLRPAFWQQDMKGRFVAAAVNLNP
ncbi:TagF domain-containing protein [Collimonas silvisoli]|uniref:TagF domain-containing protein n=1 Tax=Collimonas silvisoli TaxID=2825884 RepID=UPI001B8BC2F6|nr:TagF domain-containing protein [Collimonas silvisoli]